jgi:hypothetical protein
MKLLDSLVLVVSTLISIPIFFVMLLVSLLFAFGTKTDEMPWAF